MTTPLLGLSEIAEGVVNQTTLHNMALRQLEARLFRALSMTTTSPPVGPVEADSYIIPAGATGAWAGKTNQVASYIGGGWTYFAPVEGMSLWVNDADDRFTFDGSDWITTGSDPTAAIDAAIAAHEAALDPHPGYLTQAEADARYLQSVGAQPFDVHAFYPGIPTASAKVLRVPIARAVAFAADFAGSYGKASSAATASAAFDVQKNGASIGTITFAAGATSATFASAGGAAQSLAAGDIISIIAPASPDATLADAGFVLVGTR